MNIIDSQSAQRFNLNEQSLQAIRQFGEHFPGGFFIYREEGNKELLYVNSALLEIFGCRDLDEFKQHTGFVYTGMLHPGFYLGGDPSLSAGGERENTCTQPGSGI